MMSRMGTQLTTPNKNDSDIEQHAIGITQTSSVCGWKGELQGLKSLSISGGLPLHL